MLKRIGALPLLALGCAAVCLCLIWILARAALAHDSLDWAQHYKAASGTPCCTGDHEGTRGDCRQIGRALALALKPGDTIRLAFPSGPAEVTVSAIFASPDPDAPFVLCKPGCLFKGGQVS